MQKPILPIGVAALAVVAVLLLFILGDEPGTEVSGDESVAAADLPVEPDGSPVVGSAREAAEEPAVAAGPEEAIAPDGPPDSYKAALGGLIGRVVEPDGAPVPAMKVEALAATLQDFVPDVEMLFRDEAPRFEATKGETQTDAEGRFRFTELEPRGIYVLGIDLGGARATLRFVDRSPTPGEVIDLGDVPLDPYVVFTGRVVDEDQNPVPGARVRATNLPSILFTFGVQNIKPDFSVAFQDDLGADWRVLPIPRWIPRLIERFPIPTTHTDEDGSFRLEGVPLGMATVLVDKRALVSLVHGPVPTGASGERNVGTLRMPFGEVLEGRVVDVNDEPIAGAEILAGPELELAPAAVLAPVAITDEDGRFRARGLADVEHVVAARPENGVEWTIVTDVVPGFDEAILRIGDTYFAEVTAYDPSGLVVPRPSLVVRPINRIPLHPLLVAPLPLGDRLEHRDDGTAVIRELDPGRYSILAKAPGFAVGKAEVDLRQGPATAEISLVPESFNSITVVVAESREPIHYAFCGVFDPSASRESRRVPLISRRTNELGEARLAGLEAGTYRVVVFHPAYAETSVEVVVPGEPVVVEMRQGGILRGRVHVKERPPAEERFIAMGKDRSFPRFTVTDELGLFEITHVEPGEYTVTVMRRFANKSLGDQIGGGFEQYFPERFITVTIVEGQVTEIDVDLHGTGDDGPTATLRGSVVVNGRAADGVTVSAVADGDWRSMKSAVTDRNGRFDFGEVPAKKTVVSVRQKGRAGAFMFGRMAEQQVELAANEVREIAFDLRTGYVRGRVRLDRDGSPVLGAEVHLRSAEGDETFGFGGGGRFDTVTERDGAFSFDGVPEGRYTLRVNKQGLADAAVPDVRVSYNAGPPPIEVRLEGGVVVRGTVLLPAGEDPGRWVFVEFRNQEEPSVRSGDGVDTETMEFVVEGVKPGKYEVRIHAGGRRERYENVMIDVPRSGLEGVVLRAVPKEEDEEEEDEDG